MHGFYTNGRVRHISLLPCPNFASWQDSTAAKAAGFTVKGKLLLAEKAFLYDSIKGKFLGYGNTFDITTAQSMPSLFSALPYQVKKIQLALPASINAGDIANITAGVRIAGKGKMENHILLMRAFRPDGTESLELRKIRLAPGGKFTFKFAPALNEKGVWNITVKDAATGITAKQKISVK